MGKMMTASIGLSLAAAAAIRVGAAQQTPATAAPAQQRTFTAEELAALSKGMPDGPGRELTVRVCAQCHEPQRAAALRLTRDGWEGVISKMVSLGAKATDAEFVQIIDYLAENYKGEAPKPINMNSATSVELESVAAMLRKEAAAWIAYRNKSGPCKTLDDLKKVPGIDFKKIDERRDRLVCF